jgi:hypothetical protein
MPLYQNVVKRMDQVEQRLLRNEKQLEGPVENATSNSSTLHEYQKNLLIQLRQLRGKHHSKQKTKDQLRFKCPI